MSIASMPTIRQGSLNSRNALAAASGGPLSEGWDFKAKTEGPHTFLEHEFNVRTSHNLLVVNTQIHGIAPGMEMHEQGAVWAVKMPARPDFEQRHVLLSTQQLNRFLQETHKIALQTYAQVLGKTTLSDLSEARIRRLIESDSRLESLKFVHVPSVVRMIAFVGIQNGNRYTHYKTGPGIAVIGSGWGELRNTCLNDCFQCDELYWIIRPRGYGQPIAVVMQAFRNGSGPLMSDVQYADFANRTAYGASIHIGMITDKMHTSLPVQDARETATGIRGTPEESHYGEITAPTFRVVLTSCATNSYRV